MASKGLATKMPVDLIFCSHLLCGHQQLTRFLRMQIKQLALIEDLRQAAKYRNSSHQNGLLLFASWQKMHRRTKSNRKKGGEANEGDNQEKQAPEHPNSNNMMGRFLRTGFVWVRHVNPRSRLGDKRRAQFAEPSKELL